MTAPEFLEELRCSSSRCACARLPPKPTRGKSCRLTAPLWAGRRSFDTYVEQTLEIARGTYGRRHYRTIGLYDGHTLVASFKRYERALRDGARRLRAIGFGAVFTPNEYRGRGYASVMLAMALDRARDRRIRPRLSLFRHSARSFTRNWASVTLPSRWFSLRADALPATRLQLRD